MTSRSELVSTGRRDRCGAMAELPRRKLWLVRHRGSAAKRYIGRDATVVSPSSTRGYPLVMRRGRGTEVWDVDVDRHPDLGGGVEVVRDRTGRQRDPERRSQIATEAFYRGLMPFGRWTQREPLCATSQRSSRASQRSSRPVRGGLVARGSRLVAVGGRDVSKHT
jgi:hypothetical protein